MSHEVHAWYDSSSCSIFLAYQYLLQCQEPYPEGLGEETSLRPPCPLFYMHASAIATTPWFRLLGEKKLRETFENLG